MENKEQVLTYIKNAIQQENDIIIQNNIIEAYDTKYAEEMAMKPRKIEIPQPVYLQKKKLPASAICIILLICIMGLIFTVSMNYTIKNEDPKWRFDGVSDGYKVSEKIRNGNLRISELSISQKKDYDEYLEWKSGHDAALVYYPILTIVLCLIPFVIPILYNRFANSGIDESNRNASLNYEKAVKEAETAYKEKLKQYNKKIELLSQQNASSHKKMDSMLQKSQRLLTEYYKKDIVYPKYHNLPALTTIYEYLISGRCEELSGPHGAYNLYEDEVRKDTVISQLNLVIDNLESIKQSQYMLYQVVSSIQHNTSVMTQAIQNISTNTKIITELAEINTYYTALNARCNMIATSYQLLN